MPTGILYALAAAALFGASTPFAKMLGEVSPVLLAGLLYLGSGVGLSLVRLVRCQRTATFTGRRPFSRCRFPLG